MTVRPNNSGRFSARPVPARAGIGLRTPHYQELLANPPGIGWVEVHSENFFMAGGPQLQLLEKVRELYPLSLHGVGLSLGSTDELQLEHLEALRRLTERFAPGLVSEHLCWCGVDGTHFNDLLPLPYTEEALAHMHERVTRVQEYLGRRILLENVSSYVAYDFSTIPEWEFLAALAANSGCGILLDVNNIYVSSRNLGFNPFDYIAGIPAELVEEIHLAGHTVNVVEGEEILIDTHGARVSAPVWDMFVDVAAQCGAVPTLIEWDTDIPALDVLVAEAYRADSVMEAAHALAA